MVAVAQLKKDWGDANGGRILNALKGAGRSLQGMGGKSSWQIKVPWDHERKRERTTAEVIHLLGVRAYPPSRIARPRLLFLDPHCHALLRSLPLPPP